MKNHFGMFWVTGIMVTFLVVGSFANPGHAQASTFTDNFDAYTSSGTSTNGLLWTVYPSTAHILPFPTTSGCYTGGCVYAATSTGSNQPGFQLNNQTLGDGTSGSVSIWVRLFGPSAGSFVGTNAFFEVCQTTDTSTCTQVSVKNINGDTGWTPLQIQWKLTPDGQNYEFCTNQTCTSESDFSINPNVATSTLSLSVVHVYVSGNFSTSVGDQAYFDDFVSTSTSYVPSCTVNCNSNVIFLPGLEGSNLYSPSLLGDQVWDPILNGQSATTILDLTNSATADSVYARDGQIIGTAYQIPFVFPGYKVYTPFINQMNSLTASGTIAAWEPIAYDWRLDYNTLLNNGNKTSDGKIYYRGTSAGTTTPYIIQELKNLAATSRTGKVTIVAHSNGGLLAKALLMQPGIAAYVDKVILVATPQLGTSKTIGAILHGYDAGLPKLATLLFNDADGRYVGQNMPSAYNILPSSQYFANVLNPVITFDPTTMGWMATKYGSSITSTSTLRNFMTDATRPTPSYSDLDTPSVANYALFDSAVSAHSSLDRWAPPSGVQLITIAGWGRPTLSGIKYEMLPKSYPGILLPQLATTTDLYFAIDGDDTVADASAQWSNVSTSTKYWANLMDYNQNASADISHINIFKADPVRNLLSTLLTNGSTSTLPQYISTSRPSCSSNCSRIYFKAHSPITLGFTDSSGNYTGSTATTTVFNAPGVDYQRFGEVQWLSVPASTTGQVVMHGTASGSFALDVQSINGNTTLATTTFAAVPSSTSTIATINLTATSSPTASSTLLVDQDGNGTVDLTLQAVQGAVVLPPQPPAVTLVSTSTATYVVHYDNLPANSVLAFANVSHTVVGGYRTPIAAGGSGTTTIVAYGLASGYASIKALATTTATTSLAESAQFYVSGTASPSLTYVSGDVTGQTVTVTYNHIPSNNELVFVNTTSGAVVSGHATTVTAGSAGTTTISVAGITPYGQYYLRARDATTHTTPTYAQTVNFYISDPSGGDGL